MPRIRCNTGPGFNGGPCGPAPCTGECTYTDGPADYSLTAEDTTGSEFYDTASP